MVFIGPEFLSQVGGDYGKQRLYGAIGYGAGGYAAGMIAAAISIAWCFNMVVALSCVSLFILVRYIPSFERDEVQVAFSKSMSHILSKRDLIVLFVIVLLAGVMGGLIDSFLFLYYFNLSSQSPALVGVVIAIETTSELPLFFHANYIIERFGTPKCIFLGLLCYLARFICYVFVENPWLALPIEALHGVTFGLVWAAFTNYVYQSSPEGTHGTMIGLLAAVQKGMGGAFGTLVGGYVYEYYGPRVMWGLAALCVPCAAVFAAMFAYLARSKSASTTKPPRAILLQHSSSGSYGSIEV